MNLYRNFSILAAGTTLVATLGCLANVIPPDATQSTLAPVATKPGATVMDMSANPDNYCPSVNHIVAKVKEAQAANQKIIVALGETHAVSAHTRLAELVRQGLKHAGIGNFIIVEEAQYKLLEKLLPRLFPHEEMHFYFRSAQALSLLEENDPKRYNRLQALALSAFDNSMSSLTNIANLTTWLKEAVDVRLIDISKEGGYLDMRDDRTAIFVNDHASKDTDDKTYIATTDTEGIRLRNLWMAEHMRKILQQTDIVILQTGNTHLDGHVSTTNHQEYEQSLHALFHDKMEHNIRFLTVFQEFSPFTTFKNIAPSGQAVMNNPDTLILRGGNSYWASEFQLEKEITMLKDISNASSIPEATSPFKSEKDFRTQMAKNKQILKEELDDIIRVYSPAKSLIHAPF